MTNFKTRLKQYMVSDIAKYNKAIPHILIGMENDITKWDTDSWNIYGKVWMLIYDDLDGYYLHEEEVYHKTRLPDEKVVKVIANVIAKVIAEVNMIAQYYKSMEIIQSNNYGKYKLTNQE